MKDAELSASFKMKDDSPSLSQNETRRRFKEFHLWAFRFLQNKKMTLRVVRMKDADALKLSSLGFPLPSK